MACLSMLQVSLRRTHKFHQGGGVFNKVKFFTEEETSGTPVVVAAVDADVASAPWPSDKRTEGHDHHIHPECSGASGDRNTEI